MQVIIVDNWKSQLDLISGLFDHTGCDVRRVEFSSGRTRESLLNELVGYLEDDTCIVIDLFLRSTEEKRQIENIEECVSVKLLSELINYLSDNNLHYSDLRFFFMSAYILMANNITVQKIDKLFSRERRYVSTLQKPVKQTPDGNFVLDTGEFMGFLYQEHLDEQYYTTDIQQIFVNMVLYGRH